MEFLKSNAGKIAIGVVILAVAGILAIRNSGGGSSDPGRGLPGTYTCVCAETGETFHIKREEIKMIPIANPKTGEPTVFPVTEDENGDYHIDVRRQGALRDLGERNKFIDPDTLRVKK